MLWQELTAKEFGTCVEKSGGVCLLPIGVLEKHGDHLPLGTDMYTATEVSRMAAEISPAVVFPYYFLGQISEARHYKGTIAASHRLIMDALLEMCDEIHRNGFTKIVIVNGHGGNNAFLSFFLQEFPRLNRDYAVYSYMIGQMTAEQREEVCKASGVRDMGSHAGFMETAVIMHLKPELVHMDQVDVSQSASLNRLTELKAKGVNPSFGWYADYPYHFAGDPTKATAEAGKLIAELCTRNLADVINGVKADGTLPELIREYGPRGQNPQ